MSVLTAGKGVGLESVAHGIIGRYRRALVEPPILIYVDSQCCGKSRLMNIFSKAWPDVHIRLDVWHFMRRLAVGVTTDTHRLTGTYMGQLSAAIFQRDRDDLNRLKEAKRCELVQGHFIDPTDTDIFNRINRNEMALYCRRTTRGVDTTTAAIKNLLEMFDSDFGRDTMSVPLLHHERIWEIWKLQEHHVKCLQDTEGVQLYMQTGTLKKGGKPLPVYPCGRGSTSLESFHLHLVRFIPGTSANANNFQAYLLEGLMRWNVDRAVAALNKEPDPVLYDSKLKDATNKVSQKVFGIKLFENFQPPVAYTGELIGIEYLYNQTCKVLESSSETMETHEGDTLPETDKGFDEGDNVDDHDPTINATGVCTMY